MNHIEKAARILCRANGEDEEDMSAGTPRWTIYLPHFVAIFDALHEPSPSMKEAGSEIIRHVGAEESDIGYQSDAANVWRFMIDALRQEAGEGGKKSASPTIQ